MELVSVCITTFNRKKHLSKTLKAVLAQSYKNIEVIIVDDHSTDGTDKSVKNELLKLDHRIKYIKHNSTKGLATGRNTAIFNATGKYFTFCDDDDIWERNNLEKLINVFDRDNNNLGLAISLNPNYKARWDKILPISPPLKSLILEGYTPPVGSQVYDLNLLKQVGGYDTRIRSGVDHDIWISLSVKNPLVGVHWGNSVIVSESNSNRMTKNENHRRNNIKHSLLIWKPKIIQTYGEEFYYHFKSSYGKYLDFSFFLTDLKNRAYLQCILKLVNYNIMCRIIRIINAKLFHKYQGNMFPPYRE
jgi:glycosyltransferase involved in cell wall biosynthesis